MALAGKVGAAAKGNIGAQQITEAGIPVRLSAVERGTLSTIDTLPNTALQGEAREYIANSYFMRNGFTPLEGKCGSGNCFDGVYVKGNTVYVNEVKPLNANGSIKLSGPPGAMDTQMTDKWIESAIDRLKKDRHSNRTISSILAHRPPCNSVFVVKFPQDGEFRCTHGHSGRCFPRQR